MISLQCEACHGTMDVDEDREVIRCLSAYDRSLLALKLKPEIEKKAKENQIRTSENRVCQKSDKQKIDTKKELAKIASVSHDTIHKVQVIEEKAPEEVKTAALLYCLVG